MVLEFEMRRHFDIKKKSESLCLIMFDCMVNPNPKFLISKTKKQPHFFLRLKAGFFFYPMLSRKAFATNSLK